MKRESLGGHDDTLDARVPAGADPAAPRAPWIVAGRYEILAMLGAGGMGTVYRARDRELDETVALKMLKKQIAATPEIVERFRREVKLARRVTHRNVARTFDIGEHAGGKFLTMEFIDGEVLAALVARRTRLRVSEVVNIGREICTGLTAAHEASVLHRDLKPANVILAHDGRIVITDFGIARVLAAGESSRSAGGVVGTPAYMAPEQLEGATDLDARVDVYALGVMLFELLAGEVPWARESPIKASLARLREPPPDVRALRPSLPESCSEIISKCMARKREDRFATPDEVAAALGVLVLAESSQSIVPPQPSRPARTFVRANVAVLPIVNEGGAAFAYLADGLTEDLADVLGEVPELHVGAESEATTLVTGTLHTDGERLYVALRLTTVEDGFELWSGTFDRSVSEIVAIADAASVAIAEVLTTKAMAPPRALPTNPAAYDLYLRGRYVFLRGWYDAAGDAVRMLGEAHMLSPTDATIAATYARALGRAYGVQSGGESAGRAAKEMAEKALALDPRRADARLALATVHLYRGEGSSAAAELRRAFDVAPDHPDVLEMFGRLRAEVGPLRAAIDNLDAALAREPRFADARYTLARAWALLGDRVRCEHSLGPAPIDPTEIVPHLLTSARFALWWRDPARSKQIGAAVAMLPTATREKRIAMILVGVGVRGALTDDDRSALAGALPSGSSTAPRLASFHAQVRAELHLAGGALDRGLDALREADANGLLDLSWLQACPLLDALRGDREFEGIRRSTTLRAARVSDVLEQQ